MVGPSSRGLALLISVSPVMDPTGYHKMWIFVHMSRAMSVHGGPSAVLAGQSEWTDP